MDTTKINEKLGLTTNDAILSKEHHERLYPKLQRAMQLSNVAHEKSEIIFKSDGKTKSLITSIWFVSEKYVCINAGVILLISSILDVIT
jgi:hypothetical protein